jgi:O-antigen ligase/Tfp pilus assembly protein PilF
MFTKRQLDLFIKLTVNLIVFSAPVVFWQTAMDPFGPAQLMVVRVFIPFLFLLYAIKSCAEGKLVLKKSPLLLPLSLYLAVSILSVFFSMNKQISLKYLFETALFIYGGYLIYTVSEKKDFTRLFVLVMLSHTLMSLYGIMQHFGSDPFSWNTNFTGRPMGTIGNPDFFAGQLLISIFLLAAYFAVNARYRALAGIGLFFNLLCLLYTKVLGAYIGFAAGLAAFVVLYLMFKKEIFKGKGKPVLALLAVIIVVSAIASPFVYKKAASFLNEKKRSMVHRMLMWESSLLMIKESPFLGKGIGNYRLYYPLYQGRLLNSPENRAYDYVVTWMPHQNYLLIAAETGLLGLGFFLLAVLVFYFICYDIFIRKKQLEPAPFGIFAAVTAILAASFFNTFYNITATAFYFFLLLFIQHNYAQEAREIVIDKQKTGAIAAAAALMLLLFIVADGRTITSNILLKKAVKEAKDRNFAAAIAYYDRIISMKPVELCPQTDVAQYYYAAEAYRETGNLKMAREYYEEDLKINPYCPEVNNMLGAVTGQLGDLEKSVKHLELAVFVAPHYDAAYMNLATAYVAKRDYKNARRVLEKYVAENGTDDRFTGMLKAVEREEITSQKSKVKSQK